MEARKSFIYKPLSRRINSRIQMNQDALIHFFIIKADLISHSRVRIFPFCVGDSCLKNVLRGSSLSIFLTLNDLQKFWRRNFHFNVTCSHLKLLICKEGFIEIEWLCVTFGFLSIFVQFYRFFVQKYLSALKNKKSLKANKHKT